MTTAWNRFAEKGEGGQQGATGSTGASGTFARDNPGGRLTLTTGNAVPTTDASGGSAATIYYTPYLSNVILLYDGSTWAPTTFSEVSLSLSGLTTSQPYDIFGYLVSNTLTLEAVAWASNSARTTDLVMLNGVLGKTGTLTKRFLGTLQMQATGQCEDSVLRRYVYNQYNKIRRRLRRVESTASWNDAMNHTWRQANAAAANQVSVVNGARGAISIAEMDVHIVLVAGTSNTALSIPNAGIREAAIGVDSTTAPHASCIFGACASSQRSLCMATLDHMPSLGKHDFTWLERSQTGVSGTTVWYGTDSPEGLNGLSGHVLI